jgi:hypothetical protein
LNQGSQNDQRQDALPLAPIAATFIAMLLLSPVVNPWYWLWALPLAMLRPSSVAWTAATFSLFAYAHVAMQVMAGSSITTYAVPPWATVLQLLAIGAAWGLTFSFAARLRQGK